jgi:hypothetical protein
MKKSGRTIAIAALMLLFAGAAGAQDCRGGQRPRQVAELMFGRNIGDHVGVSEGAWRRFVEREIAPRFPDGFTVLDATGRFRDRGNDRLVREPSKLVEIVLPGGADDVGRLDEIAQAYKRRFKQRSVVVIVRAACVSF